MTSGYFKKSFYITSALVFSFAPCLTASLTASAGKVPDDRYFSQGIRFYNSDDCSKSGGVVVGGEAVISGTTAEEKVWSGLKSMGLTDEVTAGIMGNMAHEGNYFNPVQYEGSWYDVWEGSGFDWENDPAGGHGVGLTQWSGGRRVGIMKYLKERNSGLYEKYMLHPKTYSYANGNAYGVNGDKFIQLAGEADADALYSLEITFLVNEELKKDYGGVLNETTAEGAADWFLDHYEIPANPEGSRSLRRSDAKNYFEKYSGQARFSGGTGGNGNASGATVSAEGNGSNVTWIGDSISRGALDLGFIKNKWSEADAVNNDSIQDSKQFAGHANGNPTGIELVKKYESEGRMRDVLIFALGTNDTGLQKSQIEELLKEAKTPKTIVLVTNYDHNNKTTYDNNNKLLRGGPSMDSRVVVADWEEAASAHSDQYYGSDNIRPNKNGSQQFVEVIARAAATGFSKSGDTNCTCNDVSKKGVWAGQKYDLTDGQIAGLIAVVKNENGGNLEAMQTEATQMVNLFEYKKKNTPKTGDNFVDYIRNGGWYATAKHYNESNTDYTQEEFNAMKDIWVNGNRTMPPEVVEHDCIKCGANSYDIISATNDGVSFDVEDRSKYVSGKTVLKNRFSSTYVFYKFASDADRKGDPFGYFPDNPPSGTSSSTSTTAGAGVTWENGWIAGGMEGYYKDDATTWGLRLDAAANKEFVTDALKGSGKGPNKILLHSVEGPGGMGSTAKSAFPEEESPVDNVAASRAPHFTIDIRNKKVYQHYSIKKTSGAIRSHDDYAGVQIEIFGYTYDETSGGDWNLRKAENFSDEDWDYLAKLIIAISEETGATTDGSTLDWTTDKRMSADEMKNYHGIMGHMHATDNNHIDPRDIWKYLEPAIKRGGSGDGTCSSNNNTNGDLNATAIKLAWPEHGHDPDSPTEEYRKALLEPDGVGTRGEGDSCSIVGKSCDAFVVTVLRSSGVDKEVPCCTAKAVTNYLASSSKWQEVPNNKASLKGGDVRGSDGHVEMVVEVNGELKIASASHCNRTGEIGGYYDNDFRAFRFSGSSGGGQRMSSAIYSAGLR